MDNKIENKIFNVIIMGGTTCF